MDVSKRHEPAATPVRDEALAADDRPRRRSSRWGAALVGLLALLGQSGCGCAEDKGNVGAQHDFVVLGEAFIQGLGVRPQGRAAQPTLSLMDLDGELQEHLLESTSYASSWLGSYDGTRVLVSLRPPLSLRASVRSVDVAAPPAFAERELLPLGDFTDDDTLFGWYGRSDRVYHERDTLQAMGGPSFGTSAFAHVPGDGSGSPTTVRLAPFDNFGTFLDDVRVSPDGSMALLRWKRGSTALHEVEVVDVATGALIGTGLPPGDYLLDLFDAGPRWLPDSSGIYFIEEDGRTVTRVDPDGGNPATLYTLPAADSQFLAFVVAPAFAPDAQRCAYVRREFDGSDPLGDFYETDALGGGDVQSTDLQGTYLVVEMVPLFAEGAGAFRTPRVLVQLEREDVGDALIDPVAERTYVFDLYGGGLMKTIPVPIYNIDLSRMSDREGDMLVWIDVAVSNAFPEYPQTGIYHLDPFAENATLVPTDFDVVGPPRWLRSWRFAPGCGFNYIGSPFRVRVR